MQAVVTVEPEVITFQIQTADYLVQAKESLLASEHYVIFLHVPTSGLVVEAGVNAHNPSEPPKLHASLTVYEEQSPLGIQFIPFEMHETITAAQAAEVVFLMSWQALTLQDFARVLSVYPIGISQMQAPSVTSTQPAS